MISAIRMTPSAHSAQEEIIEVETDSREPDLREILTPRELEIVRMVANGLTNKEIAITLDISHWTVATHLRRVYSKLQVNRRAALCMALLQVNSGPFQPGF